MGFRGTRFPGISFGEDSFVITSMGLFWGVSGVDLVDFRGRTRFIFSGGNESGVEAGRG